MRSRTTFKAIIFIILALSSTLMAYAQTEPVTVTLRAVEPMSTAVGEQFTIEVVVNSTVELYGGDITLSFNPDNLQVVGEPTQGTFFAAGGPQFITEPDNIAGSVQYGYSQQGRVEQVTGEGVFASITFEVVSSGNIRIAVREVQFSTLELNESGVPTGAISQPVYAEDFSLDATATSSGIAQPVQEDPPTDTPVVVEDTVTTEAATNTSQPPVTQTTADEGAAQSVATEASDDATTAPEPTLTLIPEPPANPDPTGGLPIIPILTAVVVAAFALLVGYMGYAAIKSRKPAHAQLTHYNQNDSYTGNKHIKLVENRSYIGRKKVPEVNVVIAHQAVSLHHALIIRRNLKEYFIADLDSTNGTSIYNPLADSYEEIPSGKAYQLTPGTIIRFGKTLHFTFEPLPKEEIGQTVRQDTVSSFEDRLVSTGTIVQG